MLHLVILILAATLARAQLSGSSLYQDVIEQYAFAYEVASLGTKIAYAVRENATFDDGMIVTSHLDVNRDLLDKGVVFIPLMHTPIAIIYNIPNLVGKLNLTRNLLLKMITNDSFAWNDPELLDLNPGLEFNPLQVRMVFDNTPSPINDLILDYVFSDGIERNGTFRGVAAFKHVFAQNFQAVVSAVGVLGNSAAFVPLPYQTAIVNTNIKLAQLVNLMNESITVDDHPIFGYDQPEEHTYIVPYELPCDFCWPMNLVVYYGFDSLTIPCDQNLITVNRFIHWTLMNSILDVPTTDSGFQRFDNQILHVFRDDIYLLIFYSRVPTNSKT